MFDIVSVIIPIYNVEEYLEECIESVLKQSYRNLEIILINDGSNDNSGSICDRYALKDNRIRVIHKRNQGISSARNDGLKFCSGKYIVFIDSDDFIKERYIEILLYSLISSNSDISICSFEYVEKNHIKLTNNILENNKIYSNLEILEFALRGKIEFYPWNKMYKKELFLEKLIQYPIGRVYEDIPTFIELILNCQKVSYVSENLYSYRIRKNSITFERKRELAKQFTYSINEVNNILKRYNLAEKYNQELINFNLMHNLMNCKTICIYTNYKNKYFYKEFKKIFNNKYFDYKIFKVITNRKVLFWVKRDYILFKLRLLCLKNKIKDKKYNEIIKYYKRRSCKC